MKILNSNVGTIIAVGVVGVVIAGLVINRASAAASAVGEAINPINDQNIFNQGFQNIGRYITGNPNWTLGGAVYDAIHGNDLPENPSRTYLTPYKD